MPILRLALLCTALALGAPGVRAQAPFEDLTLPVTSVRSLDVANFYLVAGTGNSVRVYTRSAVGAPWTLDAVLAPSDGAPACFGEQVSLSQGRILVSDHCKNTGGLSNGRVHIFRRDAGGWVEEAILQPAPDDDQLNNFGIVVALDGPLAIVGAPDQGEDGNGSYGGSVLYELSGTAWTAVAGAGDANTIAASAPYAALGGGRGRGVTSVLERSGGVSHVVNLPQEHGNTSGASTGQLGLDDGRLLRIGSTGIRAWVRTGVGQWPRVGELPGSNGTYALDIRGGRVAAAAGTVRLYRTDASGLGWAGPTVVGTRASCIPQVAPSFVACRVSGSHVIRIFDTTGLPTPPATPVPTAPADGAVGPTTVTFEWEPVPGATSYVVQYGIYPDMVAPNGGVLPSVGGLLEPTVTVSGLNEDVTYYWHVRAESTAGSGAWSETRSYRTAVGLPGRPQLESPPDGVLFVSWGNTNLFNWRDAEFADDYQFLIATEPTFAQPVVDRVVPISEAPVALGSLTRGQTYYWRVIARNATGTTQSAVRSFSLVPFPPSAAPVLVSPSDGQAEVPRQTTFSWQPVEGATTYRLQISNSVTFDPVVYAQSNITATTVTLPTPLAASRLHYWQISATNAGGAGPWSAPWSFVTGTQIVSTDDAPSAEPTLRVAPNPSAGAATVTLSLPAASRASVRLFDALGRELAVLLDGDAPAGASALVLPWMPAGTYLLRAEVEAAGEVWVLRAGVVVAR